MTDEELAAEARRIATELWRRDGAVDRYAAALLARMADRLDARQVPDEAG